MKYSIENIFKYLIALIITAALSACGGGDLGGGSGSGGSGNTGGFTLSGSVGDGPIVGAVVSLKDKNGNVLASTTSTQTAGYSLTVSVTNDDFPLSITSTGGTDLVTGTAPDFTLEAIVLDNTQANANINPYSTLIAAVARRLPGGIDRQNISNATQAVLSQMNFGLDTGMVPDPVTSQINAANVAYIIKASETLGEAIRRTVTALQGAMPGLDEDRVLAALASDLTDGLLDGAGGTETNPRITAALHIVAAQVLIEAMSNSLAVNGTPATASMDSAIQTTNPSAPANATSLVDVNGAMLAQASASMNGVISLTPGSGVSALQAIIDSIAPGTSTSTIAGSLLPPGESSFLAPAVSAIATATSSQVDAVNAAVSGKTINVAPVISGTPATSAIAGTLYTFTPSASDTNGDTLTFSIPNLPAGASFDTSTGQISGTPATGDAGNYPNIVISVSDGQLSAALPAFTITVSTASSNTPPVISGVPGTSVTIGSSYSFTPSATDADGDTLSFSVSNLPSWASFNPATGQLSGTPGSGDAGSYGNIVISVSDGTASDSLPAFTITVNAPAPSNTPPVISGTAPGTVTAGTAYAFTPTASDADGDTLTFSVSNLPAWASFDSSTGTLSGTPGNQDVGTYSNIVISVSDGSATVSLSGFSITVAAATGNGTATLSWTAPTTKQDGSPLPASELAGYRIYQGTSVATLSVVVDINDGTQLSHTVSNLPSGTHYFAVTAYDVNGNESPLSNVGSKTIP